MTQADWKPDPLRRHPFRYWDGSGWTGHVSDGDDTLWDDEGLSALSSVSDVGTVPAGSAGKVSVAYVVIAWLLTLVFGQSAIASWSLFINRSSFVWPLDFIGVLLWTALFAAGAYTSVRVTSQFLDGDKSKLVGAIVTAAAVLVGYNGARIAIRAVGLASYDSSYAVARGAFGLVLLLAAAGLSWLARRLLKREASSTA